MNNMPYRIGLVPGARGPNDNQMQWLLHEVKRRVTLLKGEIPVLLYPCRYLGNAPSWINQRPRPEGSVIIKDGLPNWKSGEPHSLIAQLEALNLDEVWCFPGEGQTAYGPSVGSQAYRFALSSLSGQSACKYKLIPSWTTQGLKVTDHDSLNKGRKAQKEKALWNR